MKSYAEISRQIGTAVYINGKNAFDEYGADLIEEAPVSGAVKASYDDIPGYSALTVYKKDIDIRGRQYSFYIGGPDRDTAEINCSRLIHAAQDCVIKTADTEFEYSAALKDYSITTTGVDHYILLEMTFAVVKRLPLRSRRYTPDDLYGKTELVVQNPGTAESAVCITVETGTSADFEVAGVHMTNVTAQKKYKIDGLYEGRVTKNGANCFTDSDLVSFPKMEPGENRITFSGESISAITLEYYPTFI